MLSLSGPVVRALTDGAYLLTEGWELLSGAALAPRCQRCRAQGFPAEIARGRWTSSRVEFSCAHTAGWVVCDRPLDLPPLLLALGWDLRCTRCGSLVEGENAPTDANFVVVCPCTLRRMANPLASPSGARAGSPALDRLDRQQSA